MTWSLEKKHNTQTKQGNKNKTPVDVTFLWEIGGKMDP